MLAADALADTVKGMIHADGGQHMIMTAGGCWLTASGGKVLLADEQGDVATVTIADVKQSNGVIHVVDTVLLLKM